MGFMHRVKVMLGLADEFEDEYDDGYGAVDEYEDEGDVDFDGPATHPYPSPYGSEPLSVRRVNREPDVARARDATPLRAVPSPMDRPAAPQVKIHTIEPRSYAEAQSIADKFKAGQPVIMNLLGTDAELCKKLLDFAAGLTYGLDGGIQKVSDKVYMLTPRNVDVSVGERVRSRGANVFGE
ncbi:MAG TPA: cell division protein SepF [Coriobacteriia bacterium]